MAPGVLGIKIYKKFKKHILSKSVIDQKVRNERLQQLQLLLLLQPPL